MGEPRDTKWWDRRRPLYSCLLSGNRDAKGDFWGCDCLAILAYAGGSGYARLQEYAVPSQGQPAGKRWTGRAVAGQTDGACYNIFLYRKWDPLVV